MPKNDMQTIVSAAHQMSPWSKVGIAGTSLVFVLSFVVQRYYLRVYGASIRAVRTEDDAEVNFSLFHNFRQVSRLALPTWHSREALGSCAFVCLFALKAVLRVLVSKANSSVLGTMLRGTPASRMSRFVYALLQRAALGLAMALCSGAIEGIRPWLIGCYRERLSRVFQHRFYDKLVYYQATVLDSRLESADTVIATYCGEFAEHFAELPYYFLLPGFECITSTYALVQQSGFRAASVMGAVVASSVLLLRKLSPPFGRIHSLLLSREDDHRRMLTNDLNNVENIAMHDAGQFTCHRLDELLKKLKYTLDHRALAKGNFEMLEVAFTTFLSIVAYVATFATTRRANYHSSVNDIYLEMQLIEDLNSSVKSFVVNFREVSHLTEFTTKLAEFDTTLDSIAAGTFVHDSHTTMSDSSGDSATELEENVSSRRGSVSQVGTPITYTAVRFTDGLGKSDKPFNLVEMEDVVLRSPAGQVLFSGMSIAFRSDQDWVFVGENGCGKTSLLRMLCGLWLPSEGQLTLDKSIVFLLAPQHSYMATTCTLFEQLCFPDSPPEVTEEVRKRVRKSIELAGAHTVINLVGGYQSRIMGFDKEDTDDSYDWYSLSGGQRQRISMARLFFHVLSMDRSKQTPVAILDEATSMMDDTEQDVINNLRRMNVRMLSVTHREVVIRHHTHVLKIKKDGSWRAEAVANQVAVGERVETLDDTA